MLLSTGTFPWTQYLWFVLYIAIDIMQIQAEVVSNLLVLEIPMDIVWTQVDVVSDVLALYIPVDIVWIQVAVVSDVLGLSIHKNHYISSVQVST